VPFELDRQQIDDVERGANDSDWQPAKNAARLLAFAEDRAIFEGYTAVQKLSALPGVTKIQINLHTALLSLMAATLSVGD